VFDDEVDGCTDTSACNFDSDATEDDGSCTFADAGYDCAGNCLADADGDGVVFDGEVDGCEFLACLDMVGEEYGCIS
jgi:hypothetical protein